MGSFLRKAKRFASSPEGRRAIGGLTDRGTGTSTGRTARGGRSTSGTGAGGGMLGRLASGLLGGRRR